MNARVLVFRAAAALAVVQPHVLTVIHHHVRTARVQPDISVNHAQILAQAALNQALAVQVIKL